MPRHSQSAEPAGAHTPLISAIDVSVSYGGVSAVRGISLELLHGEIHGLIGPNGAGKTSLIDGITGFEQLARGTVELLGTSITHWSPHRRVRNGFARTFQSLELFSDMTVRENLAAARRRGAAGPSIDEVAEIFGLGPLMDLEVSSASHGVRRLTSLARAVATGPVALALDEPGAGLDAKELESLSDVLRELANQGLGILLVDHNMPLVMQASNIVSVMEFGQIIAQGTPADVKANSLVRKAYLGEVGA